MDYGENEFKYRNSRQVFAHMCDVLINKKVLLETRVVPGGNHNEASWEKQIPFFMNTLFYDL